MELDMVPNLLTPTQQLYNTRIDFRSLSLSSSYFFFGGGVGTYLVTGKDWGLSVIPSCTLFPAYEAWAAGDSQLGN